MLDLSCNSISDWGEVCHLNSLPSLTTLNLSSNQLEGLASPLNSSAKRFLNWHVRFTARIDTIRDEAEQAVWSMACSADAWMAADVPGLQVSAWHKR